MPLGFLFKSKERRSVDQAVREAKADPRCISTARDRIETANLSNSERIELYKELAEAPRYRNQRDNDKNPESTCNLTSMAMAFEGLGMDLGDSQTTQGEENLYSEFYQKPRSRINSADRAEFARSKGLETNHIPTPEFADASAAEQWFKGNILPKLQQGQQATLGIKTGNFRHVVRLQWVESNGLVIDDPYGQASARNGAFQYSEYNSTKRDMSGDQQGKGNNNFMDWQTVAVVCAARYVQLYDQ